ncbi:NAD(P)/FAD-dependent oxidoreductase [Actinomadura sp. GTD37]|uniref:NAD(P)/FAD-dependent oxidoreductase n=1 Tax=Actinomadura sp. GTD37 TaxID=1778030 RepID=UPI0035C0563B
MPEQPVPEQPVPERVVIVGASAAGLATAEALREKGYGGALTLVGAERHAPYDRPPLSKQILTGAWEPERAELRDEAAIGKLGAEILLGRRATGLDVAGRTVPLDGGDRRPFDALVIATGAAPRRLPGRRLAGVHVLRTLDDALALRESLLGGPRLVVVGAGFLGCEVAAAARRMGVDVTLVDPLPVPMLRQFGDRIGSLVGRLHRDHGAELRTGVGVSRFAESAGRVTAVELADGSVLDADAVVVAVGAAPATGWLAGSGLPLGDGVECDARCRAAPGIYAAGDVASWRNPRFGVRMRVEHRQNATEQGRAVAAGILGERRPFAPAPYFWTDQYDARIQAYGIFPPDAVPAVVSGDVAGRKFVASYSRGGRVVGVLGWNSPRELIRQRQAVLPAAPGPG